MVSLQVERITIPFQKNLLVRWKERDISLVPEYALNRDGKGVSRGYGFGEWLAEAYFRNKGYYIINNEFDLFSKKSKYRTYNDIIALMIGKERIDTFKKVTNSLYQKGYKTENIDLFIYNTESFFFAEAKKGKDKLREEQIRFMYLAKEILDTECKLIYLSDVDNKVSSEVIEFMVDLPENI